MGDSLVSVIIPTFNRAYCLGRAIDSVLAQTHGDVEVVVIDDGSSDGTRQLVAERYGNEPRVRYHHQTNAGISAARNAGIARATGAYLALLDSDDEWAPWKLELQVACLKAHPELGMTWTDMMAVDPEGRVTNPSFLRTMYGAYRWYPTSESLFSNSEPLEVAAGARAAEVAPGKRFHYGDIGAQMLMGNLVHTSTVVLTRARADVIRRFREDLKVSGEDFEFHLRTCREGPVGYLDVPSIRYQVGHADRASAANLHTAQNFLKVIEPIIIAERDRIPLPEHMKNAVLAEAYAWVGERMLDAGDGAGARRHLLRSLTIDPKQARTARLFAGAMLPAPVRRRVRNLYRLARGIPVKDRA
jgi:glycosyltransferase involved in cell wall biosynthesis